MCTPSPLCQLHKCHEEWEYSHKRKWTSNCQPIDSYSKQSTSGYSPYRFYSQGSAHCRVRRFSFSFSFCWCFFFFLQFWANFYRTPNNDVIPKSSSISGSPVSTGTPSSGPSTSPRGIFRRISLPRIARSESNPQFAHPRGAYDDSSDEDEYGSSGNLDTKDSSPNHSPSPSPTLVSSFFPAPFRSNPTPPVPLALQIGNSSINNSASTSGNNSPTLSVHNSPTIGTPEFKSPILSPRSGDDRFPKILVANHPIPSFHRIYYFEVTSRSGSTEYVINFIFNFILKFNLVFVVLLSLIFFSNFLT